MIGGTPLEAATEQVRNGAWSKQCIAVIEQRLRTSLTGFLRIGEVAA